MFTGSTSSRSVSTCDVQYTQRALDVYPPLCVYQPAPRTCCHRDGATEVGLQRLGVVVGVDEVVAGVGLPVVLELSFPRKSGHRVTRLGPARTRPG